MCTPLLALGAAASIGSVAANSAAQNQVMDARNDALNAERIRQAGLDKRAAAVNVKSQDRYADFGGKQSKRASKLGDYLEGGVKGRATGADKVNKGGVLPASSSNITVAAEKQAFGEAGQFAGQQAGALADLRSFGDVVGSIGRDQARDANTIAQIGDFKKGSSSVLPYELEAANSAGAGMKLFGDIAGGLGGLGVSTGLQGGKLPFLGGAAAAPATAAAPVPAAAPAFSGGVPPLYGGVPQGGMAGGSVPSLSKPGGLFSLYSTPRGAW